ncbi:MAG: class I SAM-dependent methyltransferase [Terriglobales bacterium]
MPPSFSSPDSRDERERWNRRYRKKSLAKMKTGTPGRTVPDPFLELAFSEYIAPLFPRRGTALDLAGGAGRHAIWLAKQGWDVTLIDISETGVDEARQNAGPLASHIRFVVDDLTHFKAAQTQFGARSEAASDAASEAMFDVAMTFFYLQRNIFPEIIKAIRPGGLLLYKTYTSAQAKLARGPQNPAHLLEPDELLQLAHELRVLHYREVVAENATAELVARKEISGSTTQGEVATATGSHLDL